MFPYSYSKNHHEHAKGGLSALLREFNLEYSLVKKTEKWQSNVTYVYTPARCKVRYFFYYTSSLKHAYTVPWIAVKFGMMTPLMGKRKSTVFKLRR